MYFRLFPSSMCSLSLATLKHTHTLLHQQALHGDLMDFTSNFEFKQDMSRTQKSDFTKKLTKANRKPGGKHTKLTKRDYHKARALWKM